MFILDSRVLEIYCNFDSGVNRPQGFSWLGIVVFTFPVADENMWATANCTFFNTDHNEVKWFLKVHHHCGKNWSGINIKLCLLIFENFWKKKIIQKWPQCLDSRNTDTQWRHKSKISENLGWCGRQNMLWPYLNIWEWDLIFGRAVKAISSPGVRSPCLDWILLRY